MAGGELGIERRGTQFTFRLKDGVTFSDGTPPFTADSVKKNFDAIVNTLGGVKAPPQAVGFLAGYTGTTVVDDRTAQVNFSAPNAPFLQATASHQLGLLSAADTAKSAEERCAGELSGTGPFVYEDYQQDRSATLVKRAGYAWGSEAFGHDGEAYLDRIEFTIVPESGVRTGSLASGQLDGISDALPQDAPQIEGAGGRILTTPNPGIPFGFQPNVSRGVLADPAVRSALIPAIDRQELVDTVLGPDFRPPAAGTLASATPGYLELADVTHDPQKAEKILGDAGWVPGPDGIRVKDGQRLSFPVLFSSVFAGNQAILELVQQQLRAVGIDLQLDLVSTPESTARQNAGDYESTYYNSTRADGDILRTAFGLDGRNLNRRGPIPRARQRAEPPTVHDGSGCSCRPHRAGTAARSRQRPVDPPHRRTVAGDRCRTERGGPEVRGVGSAAVLRHLAERVEHGALPRVPPVPGRRCAVGGIHGVVRGALSAAVRSGEHRGRCRRRHPRRCRCDRTAPGALRPGSAGPGAVLECAEPRGPG